MNVLAEAFPTAIALAGADYEINWDFRTGVHIMLAFEDATLTDYEKQLVMIHLLYKDKIPPHRMQEAQEMAVLFLNCGETPSGESDADAPRLYSFSKDAKYIYSAILQTHGVDLETAGNLHWWKFQYMFLDLDQDCFFQQIIHLRRQKRAGKLTKEERAVYVRMRDILELAPERDPEYQQAEEQFMRLING